MDSVFDPNKNTLLAPRTVKTYRETLSRFFKWLWSHREHEEQGEETNKQTVQHIEDYLSYLATVTSGEYVLRTWKILKASLIKDLPGNDLEMLEQRIQLLRRDANVRHPVEYRAADAIRMEDLNNIMAQLQYTKLSYKERTAIEILCVAFPTMSRVAEISALTVDDIFDGGKIISIRPKTLAKTCKRQVKKLTDMGFIKAATFVQRRRDTTIRKGRQVLFSAKENKDEPMSSSVVSTLLKGIMKKIKSVKRVTAHSARKGAAVEALLSGLPIVTIQSFGGWQDMRTLERYLGDSLRRNVAWMDLLHM